MFFVRNSAILRVYKQRSEVLNCEPVFNASLIFHPFIRDSFTAIFYRIIIFRIMLISSADNRLVYRFRRQIGSSNVSSDFNPIGAVRKNIQKENVLRGKYEQKNTVYFIIFIKKFTAAESIQRLNG